MIEPLCVFSIQSSSPGYLISSVKLCRFELKSRPGSVRSGIVYGAKIYETDGANPIATFEADAVRPLAPVGQPTSVRFFDFDRLQVETLLGEERPLPLYYYGNPGAIIGPSMIVPIPAHTRSLGFKTYLAGVIAVPGTRVPIEMADDTILGLTLCTVLVARDAEQEEQRESCGPGRSRDFAIAIGPVLTTPDELEDVVGDELLGRRYKLNATVKLNGEEISTGDLGELRYTLAECIAAASESAVLQAGDLFAIGPVAPRMDNGSALEPNDEIQFAVERLGTLSIRLSE